LLKFRRNSADFTRDRVLTIEHVVGLILSMSCARNGNGYEISSENYFIELGEKLDRSIEPARKQSVSTARGKIGWQAFEYLLDQANLEHDRLPGRLKFKGHVTRAIDGSSFFTPRSDDLLMHFSPRNTRAEEGETHYPYGLLVTAINVYTGQPVHARVADYRVSERELLKSMLDYFKKGDLSLLDRGLGGAAVYLEHEERGLFFVHRGKTTGERIPKYMSKFLTSGKKQRRIDLCVTDAETGQKKTIRIRLIRGPDDSEGKPIVFVTNLIDRKKYSRGKILALYQKRWTVETLYGRVKNLLCLEKFHARSHNGVMQEIFANLLILSLTALAVTATVDEEGIDSKKELPSFKNASEVIRRHLFSIIDERIDEIPPKKLMKRILKQVGRVRYRIRPGRSYPRVSMQPIQSWNLKKSAKLRAFAAQSNARGLSRSKNRVNR
jgi:hypothetical protein